MLANTPTCLQNSFGHSAVPPSVWLSEACARTYTPRNPRRAGVCLVACPPVAPSCCKETETVTTTTALTARIWRRPATLQGQGQRTCAGCRTYSGPTIAYSDWARITSPYVTLRWLWLLSQVEHLTIHLVGGTHIQFYREWFHTVP